MILRITTESKPSLFLRKGATSLTLAGQMPLPETEEKVMEHTPTDVRIRNQLTERGVRDTAPRRAVVDAAVRRRGRFTANDIVEELASRRVGRATVFRTL